VYDGEEEVRLCIDRCLTHAPLSPPFFTPPPHISTHDQPNQPPNKTHTHSLSLSLSHTYLQLRAAEHKILRLESQLEEAKQAREQASKGERETRALYARREAAFNQ
jgi:hypothetical protein